MVSLFTLDIPPDADAINPNPEPTSIFAKRNYKPVAKHIKPVLTNLPEKFRIVRNNVGDPLANMPTLSPNPPPFTTTGRYTEE